MKIKIRFNKSRGEPNRGTLEHVWRVFVGSKEYLAKNVIINVPSHGEKEDAGEDWNIVCYGDLQIDRQNATIIINPIAQI